jgi:hypothetical protein
MPAIVGCLETEENFKREGERNWKSKLKKGSGDGICVFPNAFILRMTVFWDVASP